MVNFVFCEFYLNLKENTSTVCTAGASAPQRVPDSWHHQTEAELQAQEAHPPSQAVSCMAAVSPPWEKDVPCLTPQTSMVQEKASRPSLGSFPMG